MYSENFYVGLFGVGLTKTTIRISLDPCRVVVVIFIIFQKLYLMLLKMLAQSSNIHLSNTDIG